MGGTSSPSASSLIRVPETGEMLKSSKANLREAFLFPGEGLPVVFCLFAPELLLLFFSLDEGDNEATDFGDDVTGLCSSKRRLTPWPRVAGSLPGFGDK